MLIIILNVLTYVIFLNKWWLVLVLFKWLIIFNYSVITYHTFSRRSVNELFLWFIFIFLMVFMHLALVESELECFIVNYLYFFNLILNFKMWVFFLIDLQINYFLWLLNLYFISDINVLISIFRSGYILDDILKHKHGTLLFDFILIVNILFYYLSILMCGRSYLNWIYLDWRCNPK